MNEDVVLVTGSMYSGKSKKLIEVIQAYRNQGCRVACFKPEQDSRDNGYIKSRDYDILCKAWIIGEGGQVPSLPKGYLDTVDLIVVDEAQFLDINSVKWLLGISRGYDTPIIFGGLNADFKSEPFKAIEFIKSTNPLILELKAKCFICGNQKANISRRFIDNEIVFHGEQVLCGDSESYIAVCRKCDSKIPRKAEETCC